MSNISNSLINSQGKFYNPLDLTRDTTGNITNLTFDLNGNGTVETPEIVTDTNKDGRITPNEILDFVVNTVRELPKIEFVQGVLETNKTTLAGGALYTEYTPQLEETKIIISREEVSAAATRKQEEITAVLDVFKVALANYSDEADILATSLLELLEVTPTNPYISKNELALINSINVYTSYNNENTPTICIYIALTTPVTRSLVEQTPIIGISYYPTPANRIALTPVAPVRLTTTYGEINFIKDVTLGQGNRVLFGTFVGPASLKVQDKTITTMPNVEGYIVNGTAESILSNEPIVLRAANDNTYTFIGNSVICFNEQGLVTEGYFNSPATITVQGKTLAISEGSLTEGAISSFSLVTPTALRAADGNTYTFTTASLNSQGLVAAGDLAEPGSITIQGQTVYAKSVSFFENRINGLELRAPAQLQSTFLNGQTLNFNNIILLNHLGIVVESDSIAESTITLQGKTLIILPGRADFRASFSLLNPVELQATDGNKYIFNGIEKINSQGLIQQGSFTGRRTIIIQGKTVDVLAGVYNNGSFSNAILTQPTPLQDTNGNTVTFIGNINLDEEGLATQLVSIENALENYEDWDIGSITREDLFAGPMPSPGITVEQISDGLKRITVTCLFTLRSGETPTDIEIPSQATHPVLAEKLTQAIMRLRAGLLFQDIRFTMTQTFLYLE